ncbi:hypothetical protein CWI36_0401p0030 [Hamiltosporidium magnivora]|uniref:Uncharacterized protein n=1 Tax=Hamiltosporidium magnivora TaxID=148818 RepID=A0A4Q9LF77_9MICR|nr:hypothetical protein CWI36_0401p0030 [Hamiltosporidium magnivora]
MILKLFLILVLGYHKSIIQATSDREELLSKDEIENDNVAIEEYLWNQLTDFSRNCLKKAIEKNNIKSKNFLLSMQTSFDKFNGQKRFFDASLENNFYFILYFKISENFDFKNHYTSIYQATNKSNKYIKYHREKNKIQTKLWISSLSKDPYRLLFKERCEKMKYYLYISFLKDIKTIINIHRSKKKSIGIFRKKSNHCFQNSFFVAFNDYLNEYDQISLYHAVNLAPKNVENFECLNLHIFLTKKVDFFNYFGQGFDIKSLELFFSKFSIFYFDKMKLKIEYQIEIFTKQIPDENICLLERDLLKVSEINNHENINKVYFFYILSKNDLLDWIKKKTFNVHLFFNLGFSFSTEIFDTKNEKKVYKKIKFNIYIGLNNTIEYAFTLNLNKNDEMIEFIVQSYSFYAKEQNSYSFKELTDIETKLNEIAREYEKQD